MGRSKEFDVQELGEAFFYSKRGPFSMAGSLNIPSKVYKILLVIGGRNGGNYTGGVRRGKTR